MAQKKIPSRQCIGCMTSRPKKELVRVVRAPSGEISIDLVGKKPAEKAVNYGAAHGALAMTTPGDTTMASLKEVEGIVGGAGARVQR